MIIAMVLGTPGSGWGGMEKHTADLAGALSGLGHHVHVLAHPAYLPQFKDQATFHPCPMHLGRRNPWLRFMLQRTVNRIAPDVVHAQGSKAAAMVSRLRLPPSCQRLGTIHGSKSTEKPFRALDKVIAVSTPVYEQLTHPRKFRIFNGVDWPATSVTEVQAERNTAPDRAATVNVMAAGRLEPVKGFGTLLRAWQAVQAEFPSAHLTIFGTGSERDALEKLASRLNCKESITFAGFCPDLMAAYREADLLVISSEREGFPYVLIEALLAGCPVVATPVAGCLELLPEIAIAHDQSPASLTAVLIRALAHPEQLKQQEKDAFDFARRHLTLTSMAKATVAAYTEGLPGFLP